MRRIFSGVSALPFTPGLRVAPSFFLNIARPAAVRPPLGSLAGCFFAARFVDFFASFFDVVFFFAMPRINPGTRGSSNGDLRDLLHLKAGSLNRVGEFLREERVPLAGPIEMPVVIA